MFVNILKVYKNHEILSQKSFEKSDFLKITFSGVIIVTKIGFSLCDF